MAFPPLQKIYFWNQQVQDYEVTWLCDAIFKIEMLVGILKIVNFGQFW